ncbi:phosphorylase family protein [Acetobacter indonesiensis]
MSHSAQPSPHKPGILVGLKAEAKFIRQVFPRAAIAASGATRAGAQREAARLAACGADCLLSFGLAAGLDPALPAGTLIVPDKVSAWGTLYNTDPTLRHILGAGQTGVNGGALLHSDTVVLNAADKATLFAESQCKALDMESGFLARVADEAGLPFAVLRVVCDPATRSLPAIAGTVLSPDGGLKVGALLGSLLRHPGQIPGLIKLGQDAGRARTAMQQFLTKQQTLPAFTQLIG